MKKRPYAYDIEQFHNYHCSTWIDVENPENVRVFEIHSKSTKQEIGAYLKFLVNEVSVGIGFNSISYDYPMLNHLLNNVKPHHSGDVINKHLKKFNDYIFSLDKPHVIRVKNPVFVQVDLFLIHHYNNKAKRQSLEGLQFELGEKVIMGTPVDFNKFVEDEERAIIRKYNYYDAYTTYKFYLRSLGQIELRKNLSRMFNLNLINESDTAIGEKIMFKLYEDKTDIKWYEIQQTKYQSFPLYELLLPYIKFNTEKYGVVEKAFKSRMYNGGKIKFNHKIDGITYTFGLGGIHASRKGVFETTDDLIIIDTDVAAYYPSIPIANHFWIEQLGEPFINILKYIVDTRKTNKIIVKDMTIDEKERVQAGVISDGLKLASNSIYGKSSDEFSKLLDIKYTYKTTINGQLSLLMLIEDLSINLKQPFKVLQANTDGFTTLLHRSDVETYYDLCKKWEKVTGLELEFANYKKMLLRDVNNYLAQDEKGKIKSKGVYEIIKKIGNSEVYHKDSSFRIVPIAAQEFLLNNVSIEDTVMNNKEIRHFLGREKIRNPWKGVVMFYENKSPFEEPVTVETERVTRYYVTRRADYETQSGKFIKINLETGAKIGVHAQNNIKTMQIIDSEEIPNDINYQFYIDEAIKLVDPIIKGEYNFDK